MGESSGDVSAYSHAAQSVDMDSFDYIQYKNFLK